jgi:hypothetical protein
MTTASALSMSGHFFCASAFDIVPNEMIAKLVKAGYLRPEHRHDADAITSAIANMKQDLRKNGNTTRAP